MEETDAEGFISNLVVFIILAISRTFFYNFVSFYFGPRVCYFVFFSSSI